MSELPFLNPTTVFLLGSFFGTILAFWWDKERPIFYSDLLYRWFLGVLTGFFLASALLF